MNGDAVCQPQPKISERVYQVSPVSQCESIRAKRRGFTSIRTLKSAAIQIARGIDGSGGIILMVRDGYLGAYLTNRAVCRLSCVGELLRLDGGFP
jgi:hypothetical protein